jgi:hypothetical protein
MERRKFVRSTLTASVAASVPALGVASATPAPPAPVPAPDTPWFDVIAYGADPTNQKDSTDAFNTAIADAGQAGAQAVVYVPAGDYLITTIRMRSRVVLQGQGAKSTLNQKPGTTGDMIVLDVPVVDKMQIRDLRLHGDKASQETPNRGIVLDQPGTTYDDFDTGDSLFTVDGIWIKACKGVGVYVGNRVRDLRMSRVHVAQCDGGGFDLRATDSSFVSLTAGGNGTMGFAVYAHNCHFIACKAFGIEDNDSAAQGDGWVITARGAKLVGCEAQDCDRHGFVFQQSERCTAAGCVSESNGRSESRNDGCGFLLRDCRYVHVEGVAYNRDGGALQKHALGLFGTLAHNVCVIKSADAGKADIAGTGWHAGNTVILNEYVRLPIVATRRLPPAGSAMDGTVLIEDGPAGSQNLMLYASGRRFRISGGAVA